MNSNNASGKCISIIIFYCLKGNHIMSSSRLVNTRVKQQLLDVSSTQILHRGLKRKISQNEYIKLYPKISINACNKNRSLVLSRNLVDEEAFQNDIYRLREENKRLGDENKEIKVKIRRANKVNDIYEKKYESGPLEEMPLDKIMELKLLLQSQQLQESLRRKEHEHAQLAKELRRRKECTADYSIEPHIQLHHILAMNHHHIQSLRNEKIGKRRQGYEDLKRWQEKVQRLRQGGKTRRQELRQVNAELLRQYKIKKMEQSGVLNHEGNDSGIYSSHVRSKISIEVLEKEVEDIRLKYSIFRQSIQDQMDQKVKAKILLLRSIEELRMAGQQSGKHEQRAVQSNIAW